MPIIELTQHARLGKWTRFFEVPSESRSNLAYIVSMGEGEGNWGCSCPRWIYRREDCKHIKAVQTRLLVGRPIPSMTETAPVTKPEKLAKVLSTFAAIEF